MHKLNTHTVQPPWGPATASNLTVNLTCDYNAAGREMLLRALLTQTTRPWRRRRRRTLDCALADSPVRERTDRSAGDGRAVVEVELELEAGPGGSDPK